MLARHGRREGRPAVSALRPRRDSPHETRGAPTGARDWPIRSGQAAASRGHTHSNVQRAEEAAEEAAAAAEAAEEAAAEEAAEAAAAAAAAAAATKAAEEEAVAAEAAEFAFSSIGESGRAAAERVQSTGCC